jgi:hypothetical protein
MVWAIINYAVNVDLLLSAPYCGGKCDGLIGYVLKTTTPHTSTHTLPCMYVCTVQYLTLSIYGPAASGFSYSPSIGHAPLVCLPKLHLQESCGRRLREMAPKSYS